MEVGGVRFPHEFTDRYLDLVDDQTKFLVNMLVRILTEPKNCLVDQYKGLFLLDDIDLLFEEKYLEHIAEQAMEQETGARGLQNLLEKSLLHTQFELPQLKEKGAIQIIITKTGIPHIIYAKSKTNEQTKKQAQ